MTAKQMIVLFFSALISYCVIFLVIRLSGKRTLSKMNAFDFIITVTMGAVFGSTLLNYQTKLVQGIYVIALLLLFQFTTSLLSSHFSLMESFLRAQPSLLYYKGMYKDRNLKKERISRAEVVQVVREHGIGKMEDVEAVVLEPNGSLSVIKVQAESKQPLDTLENLKN
ncbi:MAG: DUF421 domain-containing protein [Alkalibacterium sp.]|uniref:DUF421 domain-containing protein n=1 Tax=Alkalibacterium gilvum TaxID=1130080 RepID=UPI00265187CF|nr:DUF421 domain-containing protein [Alkalibacterium sp.]MDN6294270.1 DUF421 domain-containing protein [Alkalibacterium sp.]MDN6326926.1 DUF421 domain-containing protein [Alkalibacterium sp.]MDN6398100.1 DUF421 domain-containing protein [Alkalibacterium sp.]MDN6728615.1 DUF421 domain-containing protein [Alkalibacterium sp.]